jgi:orotidine-5'-phosphate decarboxylase
MVRSGQRGGDRRVPWWRPARPGHPPPGPAATQPGEPAASHPERDSEAAGPLAGLMGPDPADGSAEPAPGAAGVPAGRPGPEDAGAPAGGRAGPPPAASELREQAELADVLDELAALVRDLGGLTMALVTAATSGARPPVRTFAMPPELTELAAAHRELSAGLRTLRFRFRTARAGGPDQAALRAALATLTERATRAVAAAIALSFPGGRPSGAAAHPSDASAKSDVSVLSGQGGRLAGRTAGTSAVRTTARGAAESASPSREETGVQESPAGAAPATQSGPARWRETGSAGRRLAPVAVALDAPDIDVAANWATAVTPHVSTVKIGLELYLRYGPAVVATVRGGSGVQVFLDLKLHDIPNTVAGAARAVAKLRPEILTVHAAGGAEMIRAAVAAVPETLVAGVTLLTSIGDKDLAELGVEGSVSDAVRRMAVLAVEAGARGLVCSPQEVAAVRAEVGPDILLITPGIRPAGATSDDQARIATPVEALKAGADLLVIGRPITQAADPGAAAAAIAASLRRAASAS